jgi:transcriptional regulator with XRE-family HTH domain
MTTHTATAALEAVARVREMARTGRVAQILVEADVSDAEVAEVVGVDPSTVWLWRKGKTRPTGDRAVRFLHCLERLERVSA